MKNQNELFPIFLKVDQLQLLLVGGGNVALEKLTFLLKSSPNAQVTVVATAFREEVRELTDGHPSVQLYERSFDQSDLDGKHIVILATDNLELHKEVKQLTAERGIITNVADTPNLCDFYLGGIVTKGDLKIAISTNGKSPTLAKRMRQLLEKVLPNEMNTLLQNLNTYRKTLGDDFEYKVKTLNDLTSNFISKTEHRN
jgi:siroheme synthase-like protein